MFSSITPKPLKSSIKVTACNRPIRIAYILPIEESKSTHHILDAIFSESYTRWGGLYTLLIPTNSDGLIVEEYLDWLKFYDPDFVYTYTPLNKNTQKIVDSLCCPISIIEHNLNNTGNPTRDFQPNFGFRLQPLPSIATVSSLPSYAIQSRHSDNNQEANILTQYFSEKSTRLISDNFGISARTNSPTYGIKGLFKTTCVVDKELPKQIHVGDSRCDSELEGLNRISSFQALPISELAKNSAPDRGLTRNQKWSSSFNLFIGDSVQERLYFWNSRHLGDPLNMNCGSLLLPSSIISDEALIEEVVNYINKFNFARSGDSGPSAHILSYSLDEKLLGQIASKLSELSFSNIALPNWFNNQPIPTARSMDTRLIGKCSSDSYSFRLSEDKNDIAATQPEFLKYLPRKFSNSMSGQWAIELEIERHNDLSRYINVIDTWQLPRRDWITYAFSKNQSTVNLLGNLVVVPNRVSSSPLGDTKYNYYGLQLPSDASFFDHLITQRSILSQDDLRHGQHRTSYKKIEVSDKGQNLRGVISMFDDLMECCSILTQRFWRNVLRSANNDNTAPLTYSMDQLISMLPDQREELEELKKDHHSDNIGVIKKELRGSLKSTLAEFVRKKVFFFQHSWRCSYCGHQNTRSLDTLSSCNDCDICEKEYYPPIELSWDFKINPFVYRSLVTHSQLIVLWAIGTLQAKHNDNNFWYLPEVNLYDSYEGGDPDEIDFIAIKGGKFYAGEVKTTAAPFLESEYQVAHFIKKIKQLSPDIAVLAFEKYGDSVRTSEESKKLIRTAKASIIKRLPDNIDLMILVADDSHEFIKFQADLGY